MKKKLVLKKMTVANLDHIMMGNVLGGTNSGQATCPTYPEWTWRCETSPDWNCPIVTQYETLCWCPTTTDDSVIISVCEMC